METTFMFAHLIDEWIFRCIAGGVILILFVILLIVGLSENKKLNKERKVIQNWEEEKRKKVEYIHQHMDILGIKD